MLFRSDRDFDPAEDSSLVEVPAGSPAVADSPGEDNLGTAVVEEVNHTHHRHSPEVAGDHRSRPHHNRLGHNLRYRRSRQAVGSHLADNLLDLRRNLQAELSTSNLRHIHSH